MNRYYTAENVETGARIGGLYGNSYEKTIAILLSKPIVSLTHWVVTAWDYVEDDHPDGIIAFQVNAQEFVDYPLEELEGMI